MTLTDSTQQNLSDTSFSIDFGRLLTRAADNASEWLNALREAGFAAFEQQGFPTTRHESWKYTNLKDLAAIDFVAPDEQPTTVDADDVRPFLLDGLDAYRFVFIDGRLSYALSELPENGHANGATVCPLATALADCRNDLQPYLGSLVDLNDDPFAALNTAFIEDGLFVHAPAGVTVDKPIHVLSLMTERDEPLATHPRNLIIADQAASVQVIEHYVGLGEATYLTNGLTELFAAEHARIQHYLIEAETELAYNVSNLKIQQQANSDVHSHTALLGGKLVRNNVHPVLAGDDVHCLINGLYLGHNRQLLDNHMRVEHKALRGDSRQFYKGILDDNAHGVFTGRIHVDPGAQQTDAKQSNQNLLLTDTARANARPQLEIYADDVKCTHGATTGQIDEQMLFYLRSRGIDPDTARAMMIFAFAAETFERIELEPVEQMLRKALAERLPRARWLVEPIGEDA